MSEPFVFSLEFELAVGSDDPGARVDRMEAYTALLRQIATLLPSLPDGSNGIFTPGFRFYVDTGAHPEMALVETASPWELLELKQAAFDLLAEAVRRARKGMPELVVMANNHDYRTPPASWGCHENYAIRLPPDRLQRGMVPFLATRHLFAGNGRIDPRGRVLLSARAPLMQRVNGGSTTGDRALYSTCRQEPHMDRGPFAHRLHLICGDALVSQLGEFLKVATTALVLTWLQRDPRGADDLWPACPIRLLKSANVLWRPNGRLHISRAALRTQRVYCTRVERFVAGAIDLPGWCATAVGLWGETLDRLTCDPLSLCDRLDPFIKLALFDAALQELGRCWSDLARDPELYHRLALLDVAYHRVSDDGPFRRLEREGRLQHRLIAAPAAGLLPPEGGPPELPVVAVARRLTTRAAPRAELIRVLAAESPGRCHVCQWDRALSSRPAGVYPLGDPTRTDPPPFHPDSSPAPQPGPEPSAPEAEAALPRCSGREQGLTTLLDRLRRLIQDQTI